MTTTSSLGKGSSQEAVNVSPLESNVTSDIEEDLTFSQLINRYNDDSMFSTSLLDDSSCKITQSYQAPTDDDNIFTHSIDDNDMGLTENTHIYTHTHVTLFLLYTSSLPC